MRILHVIDSLALGGAERMLVDLANAACAGGHDVRVCVTRSDTALAPELDPSITLLVLNRSRRFDLDAMRRFADFARQVDVVHAHGRSTFSFLMFMKTLRFRLPPLLLHDHTGNIEINQSVPRWFGLWGWRFVDAYAGVSPKLGEWAQVAGVPQPKINVIENAIDLSRIEAAAPVDLYALFNISPQRLIGIMVAGIRYEKGVDVLLDAITQAQTRDQVYILIVGGDRDREYGQQCRDKAQQAGLTDCVHFTGQRSDVPALLKSAAFAVMPSRSESGPLVLIEEMYAGLPFVSTRAGDISQRVQALGVPEFVPPGDAAAMAAAIDRLVRLDADTRQQRGLQGKAAVEEHFGLRAAMSQWYTVYERIMR